MEPVTLKTAEQLRLGLIELARLIKADCAALTLSPMEGMDESIAKLDANRYTLLVCGEIKRGKSSFINGLLGTDLLPTGIEVTTSQAFVINNKPQEAYRLRLAEDTLKEITRDDLRKFGSQAYIDEHGGVAVVDGKNLECLEVDFPAKFLPENLTLIDTPGMGAKCASHAEVTNRYVRAADAVVFVLDTDSLVTASDARFIKQLYQRTPNIFFIQTRIDIFEDLVEQDGRMTPAWQVRRARIEQALRQQFPDKDPSALRAWPISNLRVLTSANASDEARMARLLRVSRYEEMAAELKKFIFYVTGWARSRHFFVNLAHYWVTQQALLRGRVETLAGEDRAAAKAAADALQAKKRELDAAWKADGKLRAEATARIKQVIDAVPREVQQLAGSNGPIYRQLETALDEIDSVSACKEIIKRLPDLVSSAYFTELNEIFDCVEETIAKEALALREDIDRIAPYGTGLVLYESSQFVEMIKRQANLHKPLRPVSDSFLTALQRTAAKTVKTIGSALNPFQWFRTVGEWMEPEEDKVYAKKQEILHHVQRELSALQRPLNELNIRSGMSKSPFQQFLEGHLQAWSQLVDDVEAAKRTQLDEELRRGNQHLYEKDREQRIRRSSEAKAAETKWSSYKKKFDELQGLLKVLEVSSR